MHASIKWVMLSLIVVTGWSLGQQPPPAEVKKDVKDKPAEAAKPTEPAEKSLEILMAQALRHNPDVLVAESKVREAEAELRRTKLVLALKITEQKIAVDNQRQIAELARVEFEMYQTLKRAATCSESDVRQAEQRMLLAKAQLAHAEATLNTTAGILPKGVAAILVGPVIGLPGGLPGTPNFGGGFGNFGGFPQPAGITGISGISGASGGIQGGLTGIQGALGGGINGSIQGGSNLGMIGGNPGGFNGIGGTLVLGAGVSDATLVRVPQAGMSEKLRAALSANVKVSVIKDKPLTDVVKSFVPTGGGVSLMLLLGDKAAVPVSMSLEGEIQLGAVFQALEDVVPGLRCYVREYGILVTMDDNPVEGAMPLIDFWKPKPAGR